ncbi:MAG: lipoate--protein ligase [Clostridiales bacterium]|nr:lipoate--protein ligase [Clostridiales bacterium]
MYNFRMNRIVISRTGDGVKNLATDEYILEKYRTGEYEGVTLYFYVNDASVIIGRNQNAWRECAVDSMEEDGVQLVRRHTGGGAVYHDGGNLNFSFITNEKLYDKERQTGVILKACERAGVRAEVSGRNDLLCGGRKFSGCAYALEGKARGMHGTLLVSADLSMLPRYLRPSKKKLEAKGITSVRSRVMNLSEAAPVTVEGMRRLVCEVFREEYGECETVFADELSCDEIEALAEKRRSWDWLMGATPVFDHRLEERFSSFELQLHLRVRGGRIAEITAYTDALDAALPERLKERLTGVRFDKKEMAAALENGGEELEEIARFIAKGMDEDMEKPLLDKEKTELAEELRARLHDSPERPLEEQKTHALIKEALIKHTSLRVRDMGSWLYASHDEGADKTVVVRADHDAVPTGEGAAHLCGHDGHTAALFALALMTEGRTLGKNAVFLFQHAEETGQGAEECCRLFALEGLDAGNCVTVGCHNIPGEKEGTVLVRSGTFACASCGLGIRLVGKTTHAAYPENGVNPSAAAARLALGIPELAERLSHEHDCMTLATVVGMRAGEKAFGVAASEAELWVTLRSESAEAFDKLVDGSKELAERLASSDGLVCEIGLFDPFPATVNPEGLTEKLEAACIENGIPYKRLDSPFRWSEDFGHYGKYVPSLFFGIGSGEETAPLHTACYRYPEGLAERTAEVFLRLIEKL